MKISPPLDPERTGPEFPAVEGATRRDLFRWIAGGLASTALSGCDWRPDEFSLPYVDHEGRPTKLEGNPRCPASGGATDAYTQAAILGLYDPHRSRTPTRSGSPVGDDAVDTMLADLSTRLQASGGAGFRLVTGRVSSPTLIRQVSELLARWPQARWCVWDPLTSGADATRIAFGRPLDRRLLLDKAEVIVSFDDDLLGPGPRQTWQARGWSRRRAEFLAGQGASRLFVAEPTTTLTGIAATDRIAVRNCRIRRLVAALEHRLAGEKGDEGLDDSERKWLGRAAQALLRHEGAALVTAGSTQPADVQAACLRMSAQLGALGRTLELNDSPEGSIAQITSHALLDDLRTGSVQTLLILDVNPVLTAPAGLDVAAAIRRAALSIHVGPHQDETADVVHWTLPLRHDLEDWSDGRMADGASAIVQPLVRPLFGGWSRHTLLAAIAGTDERDPRSLVRATWLARWQQEADPEGRWKQALVSGQLAEPDPPVAASPVRGRLTGNFADDTAIDIIVRPDARLWDGRFGWNPWLQETPDPITKATWETSICIGSDLAKAHGLASGDIVRVTVGDRSLQGSVFVTPGMAAQTIALSLGGSARGVADGQRQSYDPNVLMLDFETLVPGAVSLARTGSVSSRPVTQHVFDQQEFGHARVVDTPTARASEQPKPTLATLYPEWPAETPNWGMSIELDLCIGCNACVVACVAENNVPTVGAEETAAGRHMYWLRIDRYDAAPGSDAPSIFQPVPCMHCEKAPCEMGCPVNATVHSPDGLNQQVYNRCIGTRTCSSYCPYKVRRFNWFDFTADEAEGLKAQHNPNVSVRGRGVMEKCTYCVQRISAARINAKEEGRAIRDGDVVPACAQACPTQAITFGDVTDPASAVSRAKAGPRNYALLEEVGTRPRTTYLARVGSGALEDNTGEGGGGAP
jgi:Fe-S-cluster-containing dehydrogenase component